jgi:glycosyltransferase involved in cell wall biosynthesis
MAPRAGEQIPVPKYSVCMTCFNEVTTVKDSLNSLLRQLDENYEVVVVDNFSADGTFEVLQEFEKSHHVRVIRRRCSRGLGRQIALENASGDYVIANLDLDDVFLPVLTRFVSLYHDKAEGNLMAIFNVASTTQDPWVQNITIGPRALISSLGGWRDLNIYEDWDIWSRAQRAQKYVWTRLKFAENESLHPEQRRVTTRLIRRHERYLDALMLGRKVFSSGEAVSLSQRFAYYTARLSLLFHGVLKGQDPDFNPTDPHLFIDLTAGGRPQEK